jgi:transcriptional regulator with XRE-family HTH domain
VARRRPEPTPPLDGDVAATGVLALDAALGGLFWGDNVVFQVAEGASAEPFYRAVVRSQAAYDRRLFVRLQEDSASYPGFDVLDARPGGRLAQPAPLLTAVFERCQGAERALLLFDGLDVMAARWGSDVAARFFATCCPQLLELGAIAYWFMTAADEHVALRRTVEEITQCVFLLDQDRLRVAKAEGRPPGVEGSVFRCSQADDGLPVLTSAPIVARIGTALRAARLQRNLSQSDLARIAGVSASAISQAERGQRGLSLETVLQLSTGLNVTLDELLRGEVATGYRLGRGRYSPRRKADDSDPIALLDDREAGMRAYVVRLPRRGSGQPHIAHKGTELVAVASGLVQVLLQTGRPVLRTGETLLVDDTPITGWRNLGVGDATLFWILRDPRRDR